MPTLGVSVVIIQNGKVLLTKREDFEVWCLPGGGVDAGESVAHAAIREVKEETGLDVELERMVGVYSRPQWLEDGDHTVLFTARVTKGELKADVKEVIDIGFFDLQKLPRPIIWWHEEQIKDAVNGMTGIARTQCVPRPFGQRTSMRKLYTIRDHYRMPRHEFFTRYFSMPQEAISHR